MYANLLAYVELTTIEKQSQNLSLTQFEITFLPIAQTNIGQQGGKFHSTVI